jgi:hypothetical protein
MMVPPGKVSHARRWPAWLPVLLLVLLGGCALAAPPTPGRGFNPLALEFRGTDQFHAGATTAAYPGATVIAQSFRSEQANLDQIAIQQLQFPRLEEGRFLLKAGDGPGGSAVLELPLKAGDFRANPYLVFRFPPLPDSAGRVYTFVLETPGQSLSQSMESAMTTLDYYSAGQLYIDGQAQAGDLAFRTAYVYTPFDLLGAVGNGLATNLGFVLALVMLLGVPGGALLQWIVLGVRRLGGKQAAGLSPGQRLLAAPGVSLLAWPGALLAAHLVGLPVTSAVVWGGLIVLGLLLAAGIVVEWRQREPATTPPPDAPPFGRRAVPWADALFWGALAAVFLMTLFSRLATIRELVGGMGLDAYHHTLVAAMFLRNDGVPDRYEPFAPLLSFTYHYGFHAFTAAVAWLRGAEGDPVSLMPLAGQIVGALPVLTFTLFGWRILGRRWAGLLAGGLAGLVCIFPAFYVNWSRFPQLLGVTLLPVAWVVLFEALAPVVRQAGIRSPERPAPAAATVQTFLVTQAPWLTLAIITTAGLFLTHYRLFSMFATYAAGYLLWVLAGRGWAGRRAAAPGEHAGLPGFFIAGSLVTVGAGLLVLPWIMNLRANFTVRFAGSSDPVNRGYYDVLQMLGVTNDNGVLRGGIIEYWSTWGLLWLAALGLAWALARRDWPVILLGLWTGLHLLLGNPTALPLPGSGYVDITTVVTSAFFPLCMLAAFCILDFGFWIVQLITRIAGPRLPEDPKSKIQNLKLPVATSLVVAGLLVGAYGGLRLLPILDVKPYVMPQDRAVLGWLREHSPPDALVLGNGFAWPWGPEAVQGSDAGLWVPLLGGRRSTVPPIPAYNERLADPTYLQQAANYVRASAGRALDSPDNWANLRRWGVTHIYIGSRGGALDPNVLLSHPDQIRLAYHVDDAWLFELTPDP